MESSAWQQAKTIIEQALLRASSEREAYVRAQCPNDARLRQLILDLLENQTSDPTVLDDPFPPAGLESPLDLHPGTRIAQYTVVDSLGSGGMGQVFLCDDRELGRKVALKCLLTSRQDAADRRERILREAKAAAAIDHPNVASVHHVIEYGGRTFIVMEYVHGESLAMTLARGRPSMARTIEIGRQLASALAAAHAKGVVHRDLKPANVQIQPSGVAKVLDFGVARARLDSTGDSFALASAPARQAAFTVAHGGTLPYMSPEQLLGRPVDERSDIYSLGVVLFEMAAGRRPFLTERPAALATAQAKGAPEIRTIDPSVPTPLAEVIAKALAVEVNERFQSAAEVEAALQRAATTGNASVAPSRKTWQAYVARVGVAVVVTPIVLIFLGFLTSAALNQLLGRVGSLAAFAQESWGDYLYWGAQSLVAPIVYLIFAGVAITAVRFVLGLIGLAPTIQRVVAWGRKKWDGVTHRLDLRDPSVLAAALATLALLAIVIVMFAFRTFIGAWVNQDINASPSALFEPIREENELPRNVYRVTLVLLIGLLTVGAGRIVRLRRRRHTERGLATLGVLCAAIAFMVLMTEAPYRLLFRANFERVDLGELRCYDIGESGDSMLVHCPQTAPPRNRVVKRTDSSLRRLGFGQYIFSRQPRASAL